MERKIKELKNITENSNNVFKEIFGFGKKSTQPEVTGLGQVTKIGEDTYLMGDYGVVTKLRGVSEHLFLNFDFKQSSISWLLDAKFKGELTLKLTGQPELTTFRGAWYSGTFKGKFFSQSSEFLGGQFGDFDSRPTLLSPYLNWKVSPWFFYDGVIENNMGGILGIEDLKPGFIDYSFNILAFKPGTLITIELNDGKIHTVTCINRLGGKSRKFIYDVKSGYENSVTRVSYDWSDIRSSSKIEFHKNTTINLQSPIKHINIFKLDVSVGIKSVSVSVAGTTGPVSAGNFSNIDFANTQQKYDLGKIPVIAIKAQQRGSSGKLMGLPEAAKGYAYFYIPDQSYMNKFNEVVNNISNGNFQRDISLIKGAIKNGVLTGYDETFPYLASILPKGDTKVAPKEVKESLKRLEDFIRFFVDRIYIQGDNSKEDDARQQLLIDKLKSSIGIKVAPESQPTTASKPGASKKSSKIKIPESIVRDFVRKIISENL